MTRLYLLYQLIDYYKGQQTRCRQMSLRRIGSICQVEQIPHVLKIYFNIMSMNEPMTTIKMVTIKTDNHFE